MIAYTDGACRGNPGPSSCAFVVFDGGKEIWRESHFLGDQTNNYAEYLALIKLLEWADKNNHTNLWIYCDSSLVVNQISGKWGISNPAIRKLYARAFPLYVRGGHAIMHLRGHQGNEGNELADLLCNQVLDERKLNGF